MSQIEDNLGPDPLIDPQVGRRQLVRQWGEDTAYSAKSHFKSADWKKGLTTGLLAVNLAFATFSLMDFDWPFVAKVFGILSLISTVVLMVLETREDKNVVLQHMRVGDEYLMVHRELQELNFSKPISEDALESVRQKLRKLGEKDKPIVNQIAKWKAKRAIERKGEMRIWWR